MVVERAASGAARVAGRGVGSGIGAALSSPFGIAGLGIAAVIILIVIFRKDIGKFFEGLKFPEFPEIKFPEFPKFPDITFPDITFPSFDFPSFDFPEPPSFDLCSLFGIGCAEEPEPEPTTPSVKEVLEECNENCSIKQDAQGVVTTVCVCDGKEVSSVSPPHNNA